MSKWLPPKPEFKYLTWVTRQDAVFSANCNQGITRDDFNAWYDKEICPLFENAVEVTSQEEYNNAWKTETKLIIVNRKEETAEGLLREICENQDEISRLEVIKIVLRLWFSNEQ